MNRWVSFRTVKNAVTMKQVLTRYAVCLKAAGPSVLRGRCPLPMHESESAGSFSVDTRRNIWACHSQSCIAARDGCIGGNVLDFVACMEGRSIREAAASSISFRGGNFEQSAHASFTASTRRVWEQAAGFPP